MVRRTVIDDDGTRWRVSTSWAWDYATRNRRPLVRFAEDAGKREFLARASRPWYELTERRLLAMLDDLNAQGTGAA